MAVSSSSKPWRKYAAYPGQPEIHPGLRLQPSTWQDLLNIVADAEAAGNQPRNVRSCGSHWAFSDAAVSLETIIETNDPDERDNPTANRLNQPLYELIPEQLSAIAVEFFTAQPNVDENLAVVPPHLGGQPGPAPAVSVAHVQAGMKVAELYSFLDLDDGGNHLGRRFPNYIGAWAMPTLGGAGGQTVAGATQTGTHGGDVDLPPIVDAVVAMHLIGAAGRHFWIEGTNEPWGHLVDDEVLFQTYGGIEVIRNDDVLHAAAVACGRFGIVYSVVLKVVRQYALREDRTESDWSTVSAWLGNSGVVSGSRFTQIIVNPNGQMKHPGEHTAWVTRRSLRPVNDAGSPTPAGRAERTGANAGREVTFDPTDPDARDSFMNRVCEGAHPIRVLIDKLIAPLEDARNKALITAGIAEAAILAAAGFGLPPPFGAEQVRDTALTAAAVAQAAITLLELVKTLAPDSARINEALGDIANFLADIDELWILRGLSDLLMGMDQKPRSATAISYALMDIHNYRDWVCSKNGDSIELFFDAWTPDAKDFIDLVFQRITEMENGDLAETGGQRMAFPGYIAIRFTKQTRALLGMQRWGHATSVEIAGVNACKGTSRLLSRIHQDAVDFQGPGGPRASLHWGQKNTVDMRHVEDAFQAWVPGGRMNVWRSVLADLTRNGRDATFSTPFSRHAGLEVVQPRAYAVTVSPQIVCAGEMALVRWDGLDNPPGTTARLLVRQKVPGAPTRTLATTPLGGSMMFEVPPGRHEVTFEVDYWLNDRGFHDLCTTDVRGIVAGDTVTFEFVPSCWQFGGVDRWWMDLNLGHTTYAPEIRVETLQVSPTGGGAWRATRPGKPSVLLPSAAVVVPVPDRPPMSDSSWRFLSETPGCSGLTPTVSIEFGLGCGP